MPTSMELSQINLIILQRITSSLDKHEKPSALLDHQSLSRKVVTPSLSLNSLYLLFSHNPFISEALTLPSHIRLSGL